MPGKNGYRPGVAQQPYTKWDADKDEIEVDYKQMDDSARPMWFSGKKGIVLKILLLIVVFFVGLILGYVLRRSVHEMILFPNKHCAYTDGYEGYSAAISERLKQTIHAKHIEENLKEYTQNDHLTGTHNNNMLRNMLKEQLEGYGLDVRLATYNVLLSYAKWGSPNTISLLDEDGDVQYQTTFSGPEGYEKYPELKEAYNAYAPNGTVTADIVYANFGEKADFEHLRLNNVNVSGTILIMRVGRISKGQMVRNAEDRGAVGVILYTDPAEVLGQSTQLHEAHPHSWWLPGWAVQRGTILPEVSGDPITPGLPSIPGMFRIDVTQAKLPQIPVQPIGYKDAHDIMLHMSGMAVSQDSIGAHLANITYNAGPGYSEPRKNWKVKLDVYNELEQRDITNVIGVIKGKEEPDRYVIFGCHYDAWAYGGIDSGSGTSIVMEIAKAFGELKKKGWKPRRTIMFVHWDAEEQGLMGSYEFVEEHQKELSERTVAYINMDVAVRGNFTLNVLASPMLHALIMNITKMFPSATNQESMYDVWTRNSPKDNNRDADLPEIQYVSGGSDQAAFVYMLGIPALWPRYSFDVKKHRIHHDPAYHTTLDNFDYIKKYIDPDFHAHESLAWVVGEVILRLATSTKLPFDVRELAETLKNEFNGLQATLGNKGLKEKALGPLMYAIGNFSVMATDFYDRFMQVDIDNVLTTRSYNDKLLRVSQAFIHPSGLPDRPTFRNILFAPSAMHNFASATFTGILDSFSVIEQAEDTQAGIPELQRQISIATLAVQSASRILSDDLFISNNQN